LDLEVQSLLLQVEVAARNGRDQSALTHSTVHRDGPVRSVRAPHLDLDKEGAIAIHELEALYSQAIMSDDPKDQEPLRSPH
jgi:hypothetical protein